MMYILELKNKIEEKQEIFVSMHCWNTAFKAIIHFECQFKQKLNAFHVTSKGA